MEKTKLLLAGVASVAIASPAWPHSVNALFVCTGELLKYAKDDYSIMETWIDRAEDPMDCMIDNRVLRRILAVCRVGDVCIVGAKGERGNGGRHLIQRVFEVQRSTMTVKDYKEMIKDSKETKE
jgi:hypothetical protein